MRFKYSLQKIVDLKENEKTQAEWILSCAIGELRKEESSLSLLHTEKETVQAGLFEASIQKTSISELMVTYDYISALERKIFDKSKDVERAQTDVELKQERLTVKMLDEKVWKKAKEQAQSKFAAMAARAEQNQLDELASVRYINPSAGV